MFFLHRNTRIPDPFSPGRVDELPNSHLPIPTPACVVSKKLVSSQKNTATTHKPSNRSTDCQQPVRHMTCGALRNSQGLDWEVGNKRGEGEANTEDDPKLTGSQHMYHTLQPNKLITLGSIFPDV